MNTVLATAPMSPAAAPGRFSAIGYGMRLAFQWRLLVLWAALLLIPALLASGPIWSALGGAFDHSTHAADLAQRLDGVAVADLQGLYKKGAGKIDGFFQLGFVLTVLLSPLLTGIAATAARAPARLGMRALFKGGLEQYPRMFGMLLWSAVPLGVAFALGAAAGAAVDKQAEKAIVETDVSTIGILANVLLAVLFALAHTTVDAGRAVLTLDRRRVWPFKAWWDGVKLVKRRFLASVGSYLAITLAGGVVLAALAYARIQASSGNWGLFALGLLLTQLGALTIAWMRCARLFALVKVAGSA